jgi:hypothetical protein
MRALLRGLMRQQVPHPKHEILVRDFKSVVKDGLDARVENSQGKTAREVCLSLLRVASDNATEEEKRFLPVVHKRIEQGNSSNVLREKIIRKSQKTNFNDAVIRIYLKLTESLIDNQPYF